MQASALPPRSVAYVAGWISATYIGDQYVVVFTRYEGGYVYSVDVAADA